MNSCRNLRNKDSYLTMPKEWVFVYRFQCIIFFPPALCVVGNKCDLTGEREVPKDRGETFAHQLGALFTETSAAENMGKTLLLVLIKSKSSHGWWWVRPYSVYSATAIVFCRRIWICSHTTTIGSLKMQMQNTHWTPTNNDTQRC